MIMFSTEKQAFDYLYSIQQYLKLDELDYVLSDLTLANNLRLTLNTINGKDNTLYSLLRDEDIWNKLVKIGSSNPGNKFKLSYRSIVFILEYYGILDNLPDIEPTFVQEIQDKEPDVLLNLRTKYNNLLDVVIELRNKKNELEREINALENNSDKLLGAIQLLEVVL